MASLLNHIKINKINDSAILRLQKGRIAIEAEITANGADLLINLTGGSRHTGCIALAEPGQKAAVLQAKNHKEAIVAAPLAETCASSLNCNVAICSGIHFEQITPLEIADAVDICRQFADKIIQLYKKEE